MPHAATAERWIPLTQERSDLLHTSYCDWIDDLTEIRTRMEALRDETKIGWSPSDTITASLNALNTEDARYAMHDIDGARRILDTAEANASATRQHRSARIDRAKERIAALEKAFDKGWRPNAGLKWPHDDVVGWCSMFSSTRFCYVDTLEAVLNYFERKLASEPASETELAAFDLRLGVLRERYRFGWRPFGTDANASWAACKLENWCVGSGRRIDWRRQTAAQIDIWLSHFEQQTKPANLNVSLNLGLKLLGNNKKAGLEMTALALRFFDDCATEPAKPWLVKGVVAAGEDSSWFGAPGSLKSTVLTDIAVHVAGGVDWRGHKTKTAVGVVYFCVRTRGVDPTPARSLHGPRSTAGPSCRCCGRNH